MFSDLSPDGGDPRPPVTVVSWAVTAVSWAVTAVSWAVADGDGGETMWSVYDG